MQQKRINGAGTQPAGVEEGDRTAIYFAADIQSTAERECVAKMI
jgi:hypothetical protein